VQLDGAPAVHIRNRPQKGNRVTALDCTRGPLVEAARQAGAVIHVKRDELGGWSCSLRTLNDPPILRAGSTPQEAMDAVEAVLGRET
jgi:hypothetical protein